MVGGVNSGSESTVFSEYNWKDHVKFKSSHLQQSAPNALLHPPSDPPGTAELLIHFPKSYDDFLWLSQQTDMNR